MQEVIDLEGREVGPCRAGEDPTDRLFWQTYKPHEKLALLAQAWRLVAEGKVK